MRRATMTFAAIVILSIFVRGANAEMKITPDGVTFPDNSTQTKAVSGGGVSAPLHLNGSFSTVDSSDLADGAVISGVNTFSDPYPAIGVGGYFQSDGPTAYGVYGEATNDGNGPNYGGRFEAAGSSGRAVYGYATNTGNVTNYGGYFEADGGYGIGVYGDGSQFGGHFETGGSSGRAVYGSAAMIGNVTNYGGYFHAAGSLGRGVYGYASNNGYATNYGGYFEAAGSGGRGIYGVANGYWGIGVTGKSSGTDTEGIGVYGNGSKYDFYAAGGKTNFGPFTGAHEVKFIRELPGEIVPGMIVSTTGKTEVRKDESGRISLSSTLPTVVLSTKANDKAVFGVIVSDGPLPKDH